MATGDTPWVMRANIARSIRSNVLKFGRSAPSRRGPACCCDGSTALTASGTMCATACATVFPFSNNVSAQ